MVTALVCTFFASDSFAQFELLAGVGDSIIAMNQIKKCTEYLIDDSASFYKDYPNALYGLYDRKGHLVQRNAYATVFGSEISNEEYMLYFLNDADGRMLSYVTLFFTSDAPLTRVRVEGETCDHKVGYLDLGAGSAVVPNFEAYHQQPYVADTIFENHRRIVIAYQDSTKSEKAFERISYYSGTLLDSIVTNHEDSRTIHKYNLFGGLQSFTCFTQVEEYCFRNEFIYENQLPIGAKYWGFRDGKWFVDLETNFSYEFYKD